MDWLFEMYEKRMTQNQQLQQELQALKVIVAYIHQVYITVRSYYFCHAKGSSECKFSACCAASGLSFKVVLLRII